jgi:hypothetical protein
MTAVKSVEANTPTKPVLTERERAVLEAFLESLATRPPTPSITLEKRDNVVSISNDHADPDVGSTLLMSAVGTTDGAFLSGLLEQLTNAGTIGHEDDPRGANFMLSVIKGVEPQDEVESMLAAQMAAVHMATMTFARRLAHVENIQQQDSAEKAFNKLARTFTTQVEALKRYRTGGEQKMTVEHVTVNDGGQAIVGTVTGRGVQKK